MHIRAERPGLGTASRSAPCVSQHRLEAQGENHLAHDTLGVLRCDARPRGLGTAQAVPYGFASNQISDFTVFATTGTLTFAGGSRSTDNVAALTPGNSVSTADPVIIPNASDAAQATVGAGPFPDEGTYVPSDLMSGNGARADSDTSAGDPVNGGVSFVSNVAESRSLAGLVASATGRNTAAIAVGVTEGTQIEFQFSNDVLLIASTDAVERETASASVQNVFRILDGLGRVVFDFTPAGLGPRAIQGGSVTSDPFSLNQTVATTAGVPPVPHHRSGPRRPVGLAGRAGERADRDPRSRHAQAVLRLPGPQRGPRGTGQRAALRAPAAL